MLAMMNGKHEQMSGIRFFSNYIAGFYQVVRSIIYN